MSSKKFFTLLYGESVHVAPTGKIVPGKELTKALTSQNLLEHVQEQAIKYRQEVAAECESLKDQAQREGFEAGFTKWIELLAELEKEIADVHKAMEKMVIPVALKAARKILGREVELSETAIVDIVANKLRAVATHKRIIIHVNKEDYPRIERGKEELKKVFESLESISIRPREDIARGGCVIETEAGIINAQLDHQWDIIEHAFQSKIK